MRYLLLLIFAIPLFANAAEVGFIQSAKAKVLEQPQFSAKVLAEGTRGDQVNIVETDGRWCRVQFNGKSGWISKFLISDQPPISKVTVLRESEKDNLENNARRRASAVTTAGAARGLASNDRQRLGHGPIVNYDAVDRLDRFQFDEQEVARFLREGVTQ